MPRQAPGQHHAPVGAVKILVACLVVLGISSAACRTLENAAARDPQKCERDPTCTKKHAKSFDCSTQCSDDPVCIDRCMQVEYTSGASGR